MAGAALAGIQTDISGTWLLPALAAAGGALLVSASLGWIGRARPVAVSAALVGALLAGVAAGIGGRSELRAPLIDWFDGGASSNSSRAPNGTVRIEGRLLLDATPTPYGGSVTVSVTRIGHGGRWHVLQGVVRARVGGDLVPDHIDAWRAGRLIRAPVTLRHPTRYANPGTPDGFEQLYARGIHLIGSVKSALLIEVLEPGTRLEEWGARMRAAVRSAVLVTAGRHATQSAAIVTAVLIGDRAGLDPAMTDRLQRGGTYHVIAISGGNIAILTALLLLALRMGGLTGRIPAVVVGLSLLAYGQIVASEPSVARALFVAIILLAAQAVDHRSDTINTLALAAGGLTLVDPRAPFNPGFQLTFGATTGLLIGVPRVMAWLDARWRWIQDPTDGAVSSRQRDNRSLWAQRACLAAAAAAGLLMATVCAELALFPIAAFHFSRVTLAGLLLNFAAIPLMTVTQMAGMAAVGLESAGLQFAAGFAGWIAHLAAAGIVESARFADWAPWLAWRLPPPWLPIVGGYYAGWCIWLAASHSRGLRRLGKATVVVTTTLMLVAPVPGWPGIPTADACALLADPVNGTDDRRLLRVHALDVDQADATLIRFPDRQTLLVDAGGHVLGGRFDVGSRIVVPAIWALGVRSLDYLLITHGDPDHAGGGASIVRELRPREVWEGVPVPSSEILAAVRVAADEQHAAWRTVQTGDHLSLGGVDVRVLHPPAADWERPRVRNDDSVVLELRHGGVSIVLPGDIGAEVETVLTPAIDAAAIRIVKAPHHGSRFSSTTTFIEALEPSLAIVSAGRWNLFGHPHPEVIARYERAGVEILQTGHDGAVALCTDGKQVGISTATGRRFTIPGPVE